jgi:hypothetical protein
MTFSRLRRRMLSGALFEDAAGNAAARAATGETI